MTRHRAIDPGAASTVDLMYALGHLESEIDALRTQMIAVEEELSVRSDFAAAQAKIGFRREDS